MLIPGVLVNFGYAYLSRQFGFSFSFFENKEDLGVVLTSFSFTMLGFLAAILALLFVATNTNKFKKYRQDGFFSILLALFFIVIFLHALTFFVSLLLLTNFPYQLLVIKVSIGMAINNFVQIAIISWAIVKLIVESMSE